MYNDMYETFSDRMFEYSYPFSFELRNQPYLEMIDKAEDSWDYGSQVDISINVGVQLENNQHIKLTFYNFRYESIFDVDIYSCENGMLNYTIQQEDSEKIFLPNIYFYSVELYESEEKIRTIKEANSNNFFYVK